MFLSRKNGWVHHQTSIRLKMAGFCKFFSPTPYCKGICVKKTSKEGSHPTQTNQTTCNWTKSYSHSKRVFFVELQKLKLDFYNSFSSGGRDEKTGLDRFFHEMKLVLLLALEVGGVWRISLDAHTVDLRFPNLSGIRKVARKRTWQFLRNACIVFGYINWLFVISFILSKACWERC